MQNSYKISFLGALLMASALMTSGCGNNSAPPATAATPPMSPPEVSVVEVKPQNVALTTELPGRTSAYLVAEVRPQVGGIIQKRLFTEGSDVKAGQVLYQIDSLPYQAAYGSAKAALSKAEANLVPLKLKEQRYKQLVSINAVSKQDYDDAAAAVRTGEAEVEAAKANLETARINLAYTKVTSPIDGRIGKSMVTDGSLATAGQAAALSTVQKLDPVYVDVTESSADMLRLQRALAGGKLKTGAGKARVKLLLEDGTPYPLEGTLKFSDVTVDPSTGSVTVRTVFANPKHTLLPGMYVKAILEEGVSGNAILVPQQGVTRDAAGNAVAMVVGAGEKAEPRILKVSRTIGDKWLVDDGLKPGDRVIVEGIQKAKPGTQVKALPFVAKAAPQAGGAPGAQPAAAAQPAATQPATAQPAGAKK